MEQTDTSAPSDVGLPAPPAPGRRGRLGVTGLMAFVDLCADCTVLHELRVAGHHNGDALCSVHLLSLVRAIGSCERQEAHALAGWYQDRMQSAGAVNEGT